MRNSLCRRTCEERKQFVAEVRSCCGGQCESSINKDQSLTQVGSWVEVGDDCVCRPVSGSADVLVLSASYSPSDLCSVDLRPVWSNGIDRAAVRATAGLLVATASASAKNRLTVPVCRSGFFSVCAASSKQRRRLKGSSRRLSSLRTSVVRFADTGFRKLLLTGHHCRADSPRRSSEVSIRCCIAFAFAAQA